MPVIIKELIIRATVTDSQDKEAGSSSTSGPVMKNEEKEALIAACVEQVLEILEKKKER